MNIYIFIVVQLLLLIGIYLTIRKKPKLHGSALISKQLIEVYNLIKNHDLEAVKIYPTNRPPVNEWASKFGGTPYWPKDEDYPVDEKGTPLILLAQLNFKEIPAIQGFPSTGLLQFFIAQDNMWGMEFENKKRTLNDIIESPKRYKVVFHEEIVKNPEKILSESPYRLKNGSLPFDGEYSLEFKKILDHMAPPDYRFDRTVTNFSYLQEATIEELYKHLDSSGCKIGGYACFTQEDPRGYANLRGEWLLLFQMDSVSEEGVDILWGDAGVANFFIEAERLKNRDFTRVLYNWDCC